MTDMTSRITHTADLCDAHDAARVIDRRFFNYGGTDVAIGPAELISTDNDNSLVSQTVREPGNGRVLLVDNGGSTSCAMIGGDLGRAAHENQWLGIVVNGAVRDSVELCEVPIPIYALTSCPRKSVKRGIGVRGEPMDFAGVEVRPGDIVAADADGVIVIAAADYRKAGN